MSLCITDGSSLLLHPIIVQLLFIIVASAILTSPITAIRFLTSVTPSNALFNVAKGLSEDPSPVESSPSDET